MIDFACKKFDIDEVIRCGFGLTRAEFIILKFFINNRQDSFKTLDIRTNLKLELSTVQSAVKKIHSIGLIERNQKNLSIGGYVFEYKLKNKSQIKNKMLELISNWSKRVENEFDKW